MPKIKVVVCKDGHHEIKGAPLLTYEHVGKFIYYCTRCFRNVVAEVIEKECLAAEVKEGDSHAED